MSRSDRTFPAIADDQAPLLDDLARRVRRLCPDHRHPERFHIEKSEIEHELRRLARHIRPFQKRGGVC